MHRIFPANRADELALWAETQTLANKKIIPYHEIFDSISSIHLHPTANPKTIGYKTYQTTKHNNSEQYNSLCKRKNDNSNAQRQKRSIFANVYKQNS